MSRSALEQYHAALQARRHGHTPGLAELPDFVAAKPEFYADARLLINAVRTTYANYRNQYPPYGLVELNGKPVGTLRGAATNHKWLQLERVLSVTARQAFEATTPPVTSCPYHERLKNLGSTSLAQVTSPDSGIDRLREVTAPGALLAPATVVNLLRRVPDMASLHQATADTEGLARASKRPLLQELLHHPQQYAKAFTFCLVGEYGGSNLSFRREQFFPDELIALYTKLGKTVGGKEVIEWSKPTTDFTLRANVSVPDRTRGPEFEPNGDHITTYPVGTRLGDIQIDEPTIGCPGNQMAYDMWDQAIDVVVAENLWD